MLNVVSVAGSLRRDSLNGRLLRAVANRSTGLSCTVFDDLGSVPLFNEDLEVLPLPKGVQRIRAAVAAADGLLISTPEYNQSMPGVVKNMVDWLSRGEEEVLANKPTALMGATVGPWGTRLAQAALRQTLTACGALIMPSPQLFVSHAAERFDSDNNMIDERTGVQLDAFLASFQDWIVRVRAS